MKDRRVIASVYILQSITVLCLLFALSSKEKKTYRRDFLANLKAPEEGTTSLLRDLTPRPEEMARGIIRSSSFSYSSNLKGYLGTFPEVFSDELLSLSGESELIDAGAGEAYFAEEYLKLEQDPNPDLLLGERASKNFKELLTRSRSQRAHVTAIDLEIKRENIPAYGGRLRILTGRFFEDISIQEIHRADLITDLLGVFAYSPAVDEVLKKFIQVLKDKGTLYIFLGKDESHSFAFRSYVRTKDGKKLSLADWLTRIPGLQVTLLRGSGGLQNASNLSLRIKIITREQIRVPKLTLEKINDVGPEPPTRIYMES